MKKCSVENCETPSRANGMCNKHNLRVRNHGSPDDNGRTHAPLDVRFFRKINKTEACWLWTGRANPNGYGAIQEGGKGSRSISAHRLSYQIHKGEIPEGLVVMHSCDNPACVNPDHLSVGTYKENTADMIAKGRKRTVAPKGTGNGKAKLNDSLVRYIRQNNNRPHAELARELNLSPNCIRGVKTGRTWSHVND